MKLDKEPMPLLLFWLLSMIGRRRTPKKEKKKEIEFRVCMRAKIHEAKQFDSVKFQDDYIKM